MPKVNPILVALLADALMAGRSASVLPGRKRPWVGQLAKRFAQAFDGRTRPRRRAVLAFVEADPSVRRAAPLLRLPASASLLPPPQRMRPAEAARDWRVPVIESAGALAAWLGLDPGELEWFADLHGLNRRAGLASPLHHYFYRFLVKRAGGGGGVRMIEAPKPRLKMIQHRVLHGILAAMPVHEAAHGFRRGRSIHTFAAPHAGRATVLRLDLENFFPSIPAGRVQALFRTAGYPERVADLLGGLCTNSTPHAAWTVAAHPHHATRLIEARTLHAGRHLPQGAPSSPALANLCAYRLDCRLAGLAEAAGAVYTRYADDLAFSGGPEFARSAGRFSAHVAAIAAEAGFAVNHRKTRVMRQGVRQELAGLVLNEALNVARDDYDRLKATLTNCVRQGPASQNRDGHPSFREHLAGRVGFVESVNAARGARLRAIFERIDWA